MTIEINKSQSGNTRILLTITEGNTGTTTTSGLTLQLESIYSNQNYEFSLPNDSSLYPARYNQYEMPITTFSGLTEGKYEYNILSSGSTIETGIMNLIDYTGTSETYYTNQYKSLPNTQADDDYIVYNG